MAVFTIDRTMNLIARKIMEEEFASGNCGEDFNFDLTQILIAQYEINKLKNPSALPFLNLKSEESIALKKRYKEIRLQEEYIIEAKSLTKDLINVYDDEKFDAIRDNLVEIILNRNPTFKKSDFLEYFDREFSRASALEMERNHG